MPTRAKASPNELERLLIAAQADPGGWPVFHRALLEAHVWALVPPGPPPAGGFVFLHWPLEDGRYVLPFFSSRSSVLAGVSDPMVHTVRMSGRELLRITRGANLILNPRLDTELMFLPSHIDLLLEHGVIGQAFAMNAPAALTIDEEERPQESVPLRSALIGLFARTAAVRRAWLVAAKDPSTTATTSLLLAIDLSDDASEDRVVRDASAVLGVVLRGPHPVDILAVDFDRCDLHEKFERCASPFYVRGALLSPGSEFSRELH